MRRWLADEASDSVVGGGKWRDWFGPRLRVAAAGYVALAVFCVAAAIAVWLGSSIAVAAGVGALFAAPLVITLAGGAHYRYQGVRGGNFAGESDRGHRGHFAGVRHSCHAYQMNNAPSARALTR